MDIDQETTEVKRDSQGRLLPGQKLNPSGRRGLRTTEELVDVNMLRKFKKMLLTLPEIVESKDVDAKTRIQAIALMKECILGKKPGIEHGSNNGAGKKKSALEAALDEQDDEETRGTDG